MATPTGPSAAPPASPARPRPSPPKLPLSPRRVLATLLTLLAVVGIVVAWGLIAPRRMGEWGAVRTAVFSIPFLLALVVVAIFHRALRNRDRVRRNWVKSNPDDPHCKNLLIVYSLSQKAIYLPTILTSVVMGVLMLLKERWGLLPDTDPKLLGGIWLGIFFFNFLVEEYDVDLRSLTIATVTLAGAFMWVALMDWFPEFFRFFHRFGIQMDSASYFLIAAVFVIAILYSVFRGAFHYAEITPNYINIQTGLTETGEQLSREQFSTRIEAEDLVERMLGFGKLIVTFRDTRRPPMIFLVHGVGRKAAQLEGIRGTYLVDQKDLTHES